MNYNDLLELKIDIQTKDDTNFLELSIFFDKLEFLKILLQFRKDYGIDQKIDADKHPDKINELDKKTGKINFSKYKNPKELTRIAKENSVLCSNTPPMCTEATPRYLPVNQPSFYLSFCVLIVFEPLFQNLLG